MTDDKLIKSTTVAKFPIRLFFLQSSVLLPSKKKCCVAGLHILKTKKSLLFPNSWQCESGYRQMSDLIKSVSTLIMTYVQL